MIRRIKSHNILNGIKFSIVEFMVTALVIAPFAVYYIIYGRVLYAAVALGIIFNCLTIVGFGIQQFQSKEKDIGLLSVFDKREREHVGNENPHLIMDTLILVITILLPFILFALTLYELFSMSAKDEKQGS